MEYTKKKENIPPGKTMLRKLFCFFHFKTCEQNAQNTNPMNPVNSNHVQGKPKP
jgi:hypothetical protein